MNKYENGKIYRLVCNNTGLNYYGSTTQSLSQRKNNHKKKYTAYLKNGKEKYTSLKIIEGGNYDIILVEEFKCENKNQLEARERYFIENNECVNKMIPTRTKKEYREDNKEAINEYNKEYFLKNKDYQKDYRKANKEELNKKQREYREKKKSQTNLI